MLKKIFYLLIFVIVPLFAMEWHKPSLTKEEEEVLYAQMPEQIRDYIMIRISDLEIEARLSFVENFKIILSQMNDIIRDISRQTSYSRSVIEKLIYRKVLELINNSYSEQDFENLNKYLLDKLNQIISLELITGPKDLDLLIKYLCMLGKMDWSNLFAGEKDIQQLFKKRMAIASINKDFNDLVMVKCKDQILRAIGEKISKFSHPEYLKDVAKVFINDNDVMKAFTYVKDHANRTILFFTKKSDLDVVRKLIEVGADVNAKDITNNTPLHYASVFSGEPEIMKILIEAGADVNSKNDLEGAPINRSVMNPEIIKMLIEAGADVNSKDFAGSTALIQASYWGYTEIVKLLIEAGADVNQADNKGKTAMMNAYQKGHKEIIQLLKDAGSIQPQGYCQLI